MEGQQGQYEFPENHPEIMGDEYQRARDEFDPVYYLIGFAIFIALYLFFQRPSAK